MLGDNSSKTPMEQNFKMTSTRYEENFDMNKDDVLISDPSM